MVTGLDLSAPVDQDTFDNLRAALHEHAVLVLPTQDLGPDHIIAWSRRFGELETHIEADFLLPGYQEIVVIGNLMVDGKLRALFVNGREEWHYDYSYAAKPSIAALFYAVEIPPEGGDTLFLDARAAYDALTADMKRRIDDLKGVNWYENLDRHLRTMDPSRPMPSEALRRQWPPVKHGLVEAHPETGRRALRISPSVLSGVEGLSEAQSKSLIDALLAHATAPQFVYRHRWKVRDLVIFDNRALLHSATWFDAEKYRRVMYRTTILRE